MLKFSFIVSFSPSILILIEDSIEIKVLGNNLFVTVTNRSIKLISILYAQDSQLFLRNSQA